MLGCDVGLPTCELVAYLVVYVARSVGLVCWGCFALLLCCCGFGFVCCWVTFMGCFVAFVDAA